MTKCQQFKQSTNKYPLTTAEGKDEQCLGIWLQNQKKALQGNGYMNDERRQILEVYLGDFRDQKTNTMQVKTGITHDQNEEETKTVKMQLDCTPLISHLRQKYKKMNSQILNISFAYNPQLWFDYHQLNEKNESRFVDQE